MSNNKIFLKLAKATGFAVCIFSQVSFSQAQDAQLEKGISSIKSMAGCYLVDYSYAETESLKAGYVRDNRIYDVNTNKAIKELITAEEISPSRVRLQHILFGVDLNGNVMEGSHLKHQVEDWVYNAPYLYDFTGPLNWAVKDLKSTPNLWTRKITNLDDGLRYQCAASWNLMTKNPEWTCSNYAPIPGRETRDMARKDYNTMDRTTRLVLYGNSWLERQINIKTIDDKGARTPLAKELGKNWYVRLPDEDCASAKVFAEPRQAFWSVLRLAWDDVLTGDRPFQEKALAAGQIPRYFKMTEIESRYLSQNLADPQVSESARQEILKTINDYRAN